MKIFLKKDVERVGMAGEIIKVNDGYARNFLFPRQLAVEITPNNQLQFQKNVKHIEHRKEVIASKTSMLAERIGQMTVTIKRKMHDDGKLYGALNPNEVVDSLAKEGIRISKNQVVYNKSVKTKGTHEVTIKLTSQLKPILKVSVVPE